MEGLSPMTVAKPLAHEPTVLTCIEYSVKNRPGSRISSSLAIAFTERDCLSEPRNSLP